MATATTLAHPRPRLRQAATVAAITAGTVLLAKVAAIVATGNAVSPMVTTVLYLAGVALPLVVAAGIAARHRGWPKRAGVYLGVVLAHLFFIVGLSDGVGALVEVFTDEVYLTDEIPVAVLGLVWLIVGLRMRKADAA